MTIITIILFLKNNKMDLRVGGKYKLSKKVGSGAFGEIYSGIVISNKSINESLIGVNMKTNEEVAIKLVRSTFSIYKLYFPYIF
jgi:hypothetical protein